MPEELAPVAELFRAATRFAFVAPEYNGSIPPTLSNAIAWLSVGTEDFRELFNGKTAAIATHSGGGGQKVLVAMRLQLAHLGVNVLGRELLTSSHKPLNEDSARAVLAQLAA
jgi:NAD(P)H-dependent FMN reductase